MSSIERIPTVASVIAGAIRPEQIDANIAAGAVKLADDDWAEIERITTPGR